MAGSKTISETLSPVFSSQALVGKPLRRLRIEDLEDRRLLAVDFVQGVIEHLLDHAANSAQIATASSAVSELTEATKGVPQWQLWTDEVAKRVAGNENYQVDEFGNVLAINPNVGHTSNSDKPDANKSDSDKSISDITRLAPPFPLSQTFQLNSLFGANHTIYLDFNGHTTTNTLFNSQLTSGNPIATPPFSLDGNNLFSDLELEMIQKIWERVAEDFRPFQVNVTTQEPPTGMLIRSGGSDTLWGVRVVIGPETWYPGSPGGAAYVGSFNWNSDTPAFVFTNHLGNSEKNIAEAISHEVGHTLGLSHDGNSVVVYYEGHGSGPTGWAPIMGNGYLRELTQWSRGEYPGANNTEDDLLVITSTGGNGFGYRADDHGNSLLSASLLNNVSGGVSAAGIIERNTDIDYFRLNTFSGNVSLNIEPFYRSPNLDIWARVHDSIGTVIATSNPTHSLGASFSLNLNPNSTYYVSVTGTGKPASITENGYSDYGSLGAYTIQGFVAPHLPDLVGWWTDVLASNLSWGQSFDVFGQVRNIGEGNANVPFYQDFYLSSNQVWGDDDDILLGWHYHTDPVPSGGVGQNFTITLTLPSSPPSGYASSGTFYLGMKTDALGFVTESNESNNGPGFYQITHDWDSFLMNPASVVGSSVVYSEWTGWGPGFADNKVMAREAANPQPLSYANLINSAAGITNINFFTDSLANVDAISLSDFEFQVSPLGAFDESAHPPATWQSSAVLPSVAAGRGFGTSSSINLSWPPQSVLNRWLRVTLKANQNTGLSSPEVFYIGHLLGEVTGETNGVYTVSFADIAEIRSRVGQDVGASSWHDIDKNALISFADISAMRGNIGAQLTNITIPDMDGGGGGGSALMQTGISGSVSGYNKLDGWTVKVDSASSVVPQDWLRSADRAETHSNATARLEVALFRKRNLSSLNPNHLLSVENRAYSRSEMHLGESYHRVVESSEELAGKPQGSVEQKLREIDEFFAGLSINEAWPRWSTSFSRPMPKG